MKTLIVLIYGIIISFNIICALLLDGYDNWIVSTTTLLIGMILMLPLSGKELKDGYRVSLLFLFPLFTLIETAMAIFMPMRLHNNSCLLGIVCLVFFQLILFLLCNFYSKKIK